MIKERSRMHELETRDGDAHRFETRAAETAARARGFFERAIERVRSAAHARGVPDHDVQELERARVRVREHDRAADRDRAYASGPEYVRDPDVGREHTRERREDPNAYGRDYGTPREHAGRDRGR